MTSQEPADSPAPSDSDAPVGLTTKDKIDSLLTLFQAIVSWPTALLLVIFIIHDRIPDMAGRIVSIGPGGVEIAQTVDQLAADQQQLAASQQQLEASQQQVAATQDTMQAMVQDLMCRLSRDQAQQASPAPDPLEAGIAAELTGGTPLSPEQTTALEQELAAFNDYLTQRGFPAPSAPPTVSAVVLAGTDRSITGMDQARNVLCVGATPDRQPTIEALTLAAYAQTVVAQPADARGQLSLPSRALAAGLADYAVASFLNNPRVGDADLDQPQQASGADQAVRRQWAAAFWQVRNLLGADQADAAVFAAFAQPSGSPATFEARLVANVAQSAGADAASQVRTLFAARGLMTTVATPPASR